MLILVVVFTYYEYDEMLHRNDKLTQGKWGAMQPQPAGKTPSVAHRVYHWYVEEPVSDSLSSADRAGGDVPPPIGNDGSQVGRDFVVRMRRRAKVGSEILFTYPMLVDGGFL